MNKADNLRNPVSCLNRAATDEPLFVLRAKDLHAAQAVRHWAAMADGTHEPDKIAAAVKLADEMDAWRNARFDGEGRPWPHMADPERVG